MKKILYISLLLLGFTSVSNAGQFTATAAGFDDYSELSWSPAGTPGVNDTVIITISGALTFDQTISLSRIELVDDGGFGARISANITLTGGIDFDDISTSFSGGGNSTLTIGRALSNTSQFNPSGGRVHYNGNIAQTVRAKTYGDLIFSGTGQKNITNSVTVEDTVYFNSSTVRITGNLNIAEDNGVLELGSGTMIITNSGVYTLNTGAVMNCGSGIVNVSSASTTLTFNGTVNEGTSEFIFSATTGVQTLVNDQFYDLTITGGGIKQFEDATSANVVNDLTISGGTFSLGTADITIEGDFINNSIFAPGTKKVTFQGSNPSSITGSTNTSFFNLEIGKTTTSSPVTINTAAELNGGGEITFTNGTSQLNTNGNLTLLSTSATTGARIGAIPSGSSVVGNVTVQRFIPSQSFGTRAWWHISNPVEDVTVAQWQDSIIVTGDFTGSNTTINGSRNPSLYYYDETDPDANLDSGWVAFPTSTNTETFEEGRGYRIFIRQDTTTIVADETVSVSGIINQGNFSFPVSYTSSGTAEFDGWNFVGNPYPSAINFNNANWTKTNVINTGYIWDAQNGLYTLTSSDPVIAPMQGFWVQANAANPVLSITEDVKTDAAFTFQRPSQSSNNIEISLVSPNELRYAIARTEVVFNNFSSLAFEEDMDITFLPKSFAIDEKVVDIASRSLEGRRLMKNNLPITSETEIQLFTAYSEQEEYELEIIPRSLESGYSLLLKDTYTNDLITVDGNTIYPFTINEDPASWSSDRFILVADQLLSTNNTEDLAKAFVLYPNPATNNATVTIQNYNQNGAVSLTTLQGEVIEELIIDKSNINSSYNFDISKLNKGIYLVKFASKNYTQVEKLIVE